VSEMNTADLQTFIKIHNVNTMAKLQTQHLLITRNSLQWFDHESVHYLSTAPLFYHYKSMQIVSGSHSELCTML
jgi:hypothetical protein